MRICNTSETKTVQLVCQGEPGLQVFPDEPAAPHIFNLKPLAVCSTTCSWCGADFTMPAECELIDEAKLERVKDKGHDGIACPMRLKE